MKKGIKALLIVAVCMIAVGIIMCASSLLFIRNLDYGEYSTKISESVNRVLHRLGVDDDVEVSLGSYHFGVYGSSKRQFGSGDTDSVTGGEVNRVPAADVHSIEINWVDGDIEICSAEDSDEIVFTEEYSGNSEPLEYTLEGGRLIIDYCKATRSFIGINLNNLWDAKSLKVSIPASLRGELRRLSVDTVSSKCVVSDQGADKLYINTVSGKIEADGDFREIDADSVSGRVDITCGTLPDDMDIDTVSGGVRLTLPENDGFSVEFDSVSGDLKSDLALARFEERYTYKNGGPDFAVDTVSGDLNINVK
ncbi:MAG: DUF4097 family beta strand repeat protein [Oscillospiraceae bacterium]|nr:DUF4097 family beta strand repeat protein [Oscillospiraceae bacterium]